MRNILLFNAMLMFLMLAAANSKALDLALGINGNGCYTENMNEYYQPWRGYAVGGGLFSVIKPENLYGFELFTGYSFNRQYITSDKLIKAVDFYINLLRYGLSLKFWPFKNGFHTGIGLLGIYTLAGHIDAGADTFLFSRENLGNNFYYSFFLGYDFPLGKNLFLPVQLRINNSLSVGSAGIIETELNLGIGYNIIFRG